MGEFFKLARPSGLDFKTGKTNYREAIGKDVVPPKANAALGLCSEGVIHASRKPNDCFVGANIPCSAYSVSGVVVAEDESKCGFVKLHVVEEITDLDTLFGWNYTEACNPINPLKLGEKKPTAEDIELLRDWSSVRSSVGYSVWDSVRDSVGSSVRSSVGYSVWDSVRDSVWDSVGDSIWDSVGDSVWDSVGGSVWASAWGYIGASIWAYIGYLFPCVEKWEGIDYQPGEYPFQSVADLWRRGFVPSFDGKIWRLHSGEKAEIVWEGEVCHDRAE